MPNVIRVKDAETLEFQGKSYRCAIGKNGFSNNKREGDGCTPIGVFPLRECWFRDDRISEIITKLPTKITTQNDGWSDDSKASDYNRAVKLPYAFSHENLWRADHVYDIIVPLGYNDDPVISGRGSAIFFHLAQPDYTPTEGCVAILLADMLEILPHLSVATRMEIAVSC